MSKSGLLVAELLTSCFGETEAGSSWLVMNQTIACVPISATDKRWRAIGSREFVRPATTLTTGFHTAQLPPPSSAGPCRGNSGRTSA